MPCFHGKITTKLIEGAFWGEQRISEVDGHIEIIPILQAVLGNREGYGTNEGAVDEREVRDILQVVGDAHLGTAVHCVE